MYKYKAFGLNIHSEIFLPELVQYESENPDLIIHYDTIDIISDEFLVKGKTFRVTKNSIYKFFDDIGKFKISNGNEIIIDPYKNVNEVVLRSFILGTVMASLLYQRGLFVIHSSAVNLNDTVIAFLGNKGYGKSTIAMTFYKEGYPIIADDYIAVNPENEVPLVYPGFPSLRLSYKSRKHGNFSLKRVYYKEYEIDKLHVPTDNNFSLKEISLKKLYILKRGETLRITSLKTQEAVMKLIENTFEMTLFKKSDFVENLNHCVSSLKHIDISLLEIPESLDEMYKVVELVKNDLGL